MAYLHTNICIRLYELVTFRPIKKRKSRHGLHILYHIGHCSEKADELLHDGRMCRVEYFCTESSNKADHGSTAVERFGKFRETLWNAVVGLPVVRW